MQVILMKEVGNLGRPGDVVFVKDGYARNFLLPRKLAIKATPRALRQAEQMRTAEDRREDNRRGDAEKQAARLQNLELEVTAAVGEQGRLYGSVTAAQIAELIHEGYHVEVDRRRIHLEQPIRTIGAHTVEIELHRDVRVPVIVRVHGEGGPEAEVEAEPEVAAEPVAEAEPEVAAEPVAEAEPEVLEEEDEERFEQ